MGGQKSSNPEKIRYYLARQRERKGPAPAQSPGQCVHLGQPTGELEMCPTCRGGKVQLKVFACAVYATGCTIAKPVAGRACCAGCPSYSLRTQRPR